jgi:hypothetical protein
MADFDTGRTVEVAEGRVYPVIIQNPARDAWFAEGLARNDFLPGWERWLQILPQPMGSVSTADLRQNSSAQIPGFRLHLPEFW